MESLDGQAPRNSPADDSASQPQSSPAAVSHDEPNVDALSAMTPRFNLPFRWFAKRFFSHFDVDDATVEHLRKLETRGSIIYVMRYASRLDYFLFNTLFVREGLRLSSFANGIRFFYYRPWLEALRIIWKRPRGVPQDIELVRRDILIKLGAIVVAGVTVLAAMIGVVIAMIGL